MSMPSGNNNLVIAAADKIQFPINTAAVGVGVEIHHNPLHQQQPQWFPDERDTFISWIRSEFAASNAIIDSLCYHLGEIGEPGEYDSAIAFIQQRRINWTPVLHMQQYFPVTEVVVSLQQVASKKKQQRYYDQPKMTGNNNSFKRSGGGGGGMSYRYHMQGPRGDPPVVQNAALENRGLDRNERATDRYDESKTGGDINNVGDKENTTKVAKSQTDGNCGNSESNSGASSDRLAINSKDDNSKSTQNSDGRNSIPKTFVATEIIDGKPVNVVDGLKLYEEMLDDGEVSKLVSLVNDMRAAGKKGQLHGLTYRFTKKPMKGHGRETIQFGVHIADELVDNENVAGTTSKERKVDPIPASLQEIVDRLVSMQLVNVKPDACIIEIYNEGDHSQPNLCPSRYGRPICMLFLTECDMTFGKMIVGENPGDFRGSLKLCLEPGSVLVMQGNSADFSRHAIHSIRKQRMIITFTKSQPRKTHPADVHRQHSAALSSSSHWGPQPSRSPNHIRPGPKHYAPIPTNGVLPGPPFRAQMAPSNGVQPLFVPAAVPFPGSVQIPPGSNGWGPRHPPPRFPLPGTGVFLPPQGSGNSTHQQSSTDSSLNSQAEKENGRSNQTSSGGSVKGKLDGKVENGSIDETSNGKGIAVEEQVNLESAVASKPASAV
ncbi:hypothetical protein ACFE04_020193 [Oxalis oulophora]